MNSCSYFDIMFKNNKEVLQVNTKNNYITKYQNELNLVPLKDFKAIEIDLFFSICTKIKEQGTRKVKYTFEDLRELSNYHSHNTRERFINDLQHVYDKMQQLVYTERTEKKIRKFNLFSFYEIDLEDDYVEIALNKDLEHILNNLTGNFTRFELQELTSIQSAYSKNMFRLLKQFRNTGLYKVSLDDFKELLDIPYSRICDIDARVLKIIQRDLTDSFENLEINKIKKGRKIVALEFTFNRENLKKKKKEVKIDETLRSQSEEMFKEFIN